MGLFGNMLVDSPDASYYSPVNREQMLDARRSARERGHVIPFGKEAADFALMGRVGNVLLVNGEPRYTLARGAGEVVRFYPHQRLELAHLQHLIRRRADQGRRRRT